MIGFRNYKSWVPTAATDQIIMLLGYDTLQLTVLNYNAACNFTVDEYVHQKKVNTFSIPVAANDSGLLYDGLPKGTHLVIKSDLFDPAGSVAFTFESFGRF